MSRLWFHVLGCEGYIHKYHRFIDDLKIKWAVNEPLWNMNDSGFCDDMLLTFLAYRVFDFCIKIGNIERVGTVKMEELVEIMRMGFLCHEKGFCHTIP